MSRSRRRAEATVLAVIVGLVALAALADGTPSGLKEVHGYEGIWKRCYEPGLPGVSEIDEGYLVLMPDGRYYELSEGCCYGPDDPKPPFWSLDSYRVEDDGVVLSATRYDGSHYERPLRHRERAKAVWFDDPRGEPVEVEALLPSTDLNYAWCRLYPEATQL
jgi:hypothetical protein